MSQLDQAKKESKRLYNLAKSNNNNIYIENLSKSREILSYINGYKDWHEYEEVLKRKDFLDGKIDRNTENKNNKKIFQNISYYIQDIPFKNILNTNLNYSNLVVEKKHIPIILGGKKEKSLFEKTEKKWLLNNYPMLVSGATGSGKSEVLLSISSQYIKNNEGLIYIDGKGDNLIYYKIFSYMFENNSINNLYCLNFNSYKEQLNNDKIITHSIDPINPMIGNDDYFNIFFGRFGIIIHEILKEIHQKNQLMDIESLESCLMINNLIEWNKNNKFITTIIKEYLIEIGISEDDNTEEEYNSALLNHSKNSEKAFHIVNLIKNYPEVFKINCSVNMERIFLERKSLVVLLPALEKSPEDLNNLGELIVYQIKYIDEKYQNYNIHFQNIILDEFLYYSNVLYNMNLKKTKNNYLFAIQSFDYRNNNILDYIMLNVNTTVLMKTYDNSIHNKIKLDLVNLNEFPKLTRHINYSFIKDFHITLRDFGPGEAYVISENTIKNDNKYINDEIKYYCEYIYCEYLPAKKQNKIWLVEHPEPKIIEV